MNISDLKAIRYRSRMDVISTREHIIVPVWHGVWGDVWQRKRETVLSQSLAALSCPTVGAEQPA